MAMSDKTAEALRKFEEALRTLEEQAQEPESRMARDSLLLRYVYTFEMCWQCMHQLQLARGADDTPRVAFAVLALAFKLGWIPDAGLWKQLREARNGVSHSYDEDMAVRLAAAVRTLALPEFQRLRLLLREQAA